MNEMNARDLSMHICVNISESTCLKEEISPVNVQISPVKGGTPDFSEDIYCFSLQEFSGVKFSCNSEQSSV